MVERGLAQQRAVTDRGRPRAAAHEEARRVSAAAALLFCACPSHCSALQGGVHPARPPLCLPVLLADARLLPHGPPAVPRQPDQVRTPSRTLLFIRSLFLTVARCSIGSYLPGAGVARNMTMIPRKLKQAGYSTHMIGKVSDPCPLALRRDLAPQRSCCDALPRGARCGAGRLAAASGAAAECAPVCAASGTWAMRPTTCCPAAGATTRASTTRRARWTTGRVAIAWTACAPPRTMATRTAPTTPHRASTAGKESRSPTRRPCATAAPVSAATVGLGCCRR